jgi:RNA polymerase sigma-70 factor (ECF subfamily)
MDELYIRKVLNGDPDSFRYFIETYKSFAFSLALAIVKNNVLAEDIVQESFIKAFQKLGSFRKKSKFKTWFARIVINESVRQVEKESNKNFVRLNISEDKIVVLNESLNSLSSGERKQYINIAFKKLSYNEALVLELFYIREHSVAEISEMTGWSSPRIKMLLLRGRKSTYNMLEKLLKSEVKEIL